MKKTCLTALVGALALLAGCGKPAEKRNTTSVEVPPVFVEQITEETPVPIPLARNTKKPGDEVVLTGLIMGVLHPFVEGRAVFVLGDEATITPCDAMDKDPDHCATPWDACCDPKEIRANGTVTIQILNENDSPARFGLKGIKGLGELSRVTVAGTVAENSTSEAFIVNASAIHIGER
jgi:hypothetical protein